MSFFCVCYFTWKLEFVSNILRMIVVGERFCKQSLGQKIQYESFEAFCYRISSASLSCSVWMTDQTIASIHKVRWYNQTKKTGFQILACVKDFSWHHSLGQFSRFFVSLLLKTLAPKVLRLNGTFRGGKIRHLFETRWDILFM